MQLRLPEPFGMRYPDGTHLSMRGPPLEERHFDAMDRLLWGFGCPEDKRERAVAAMHHSGRYDCVVVTRAFPQLREELSEFGYAIHTQATCEYRSGAKGR